MAFDAYTMTTALSGTPKSLNLNIPLPLMHARNLHDDICNFDCVESLVITTCDGDELVLCTTTLVGNADSGASNRRVIDWCPPGSFNITTNLWRNEVYTFSLDSRTFGEVRVYSLAD